MISSFYLILKEKMLNSGQEMIRERILLGLERRKKQGKNLGRPTGSKDKKRRKKGGYYLRYNKTK
jgi:hypothetical protein